MTLANLTPSHWLTASIVALLVAATFVWAWARRRRPCRSCSNRTRNPGRRCDRCERRAAAEQRTRDEVKAEMGRRRQEQEDARRLAEEAERARAKEEEEEKRQAEKRKRFEEWKRRRREDGGGPRPVNPRDFDPYLVLGIPRSADSAEVRQAYRRLMGQYHPDKVAHLGPELREVAHRKSREIARAYEMLSER